MFLSELCIEDVIGKPDFWRLTAPLVWKDAVFGHLAAEPGFETDLASVPAILRGIPSLDPDGLSRRPAAMHDWLYGGDRSRGKDFADRFLHAALVSVGMSEAMADVFYDGVHLFGQVAWDADAAKAAAWAKEHP